MFSLRSCLGGAGRRLLFKIKQVFLLMGESGLMHNADTKCTMLGREWAKGQRKFFHVKIFLVLP